MRPKLLILLVLLALAVALFVLLRRGAAPEAPPATGSARATPPVVEASPPPTAARAAVSASDRAAARARRDELRARIVQALEAHSRTAPSAAPPATTDPAAPRPPGNLVDRTGRGRDALVKALNTDFMPLAQECIEQAEGRVPSLRGMLIISVETVADDKLGAVVDIADPAPRNEVPDPELLECLRESAFSLTLPPPPEGGRERFELSMPIEPR